ncbi:transposase, partial [Candidatus Bathycorpusculum sp.]|uniref:transposase n=1 Tax=Candidatus Bathycorpusculum sp. TaxID=2994959 RepID=UPI002821486F|nr:transposase [Candidatus Termitimicrobium sp.]MCL2686228.1 transposase [Candidatus Termitimicrobium sp.]
LADDGTNLNLPTTKETLKQYGNSTNHGTKPQAALGLSCRYDILNKTILHLTINRVKFNEIAQTQIHHQKTPTTVDNIPTIITLDRAYPSLALFVPWIASDQKFVIRLKSHDFKDERSQMQTNDQQLTIALTPPRLVRHKKNPIYPLLEQTKTVMLRVVNVARPDGSTVSVVTNLDESFSATEIAEVYRLRWEVETAFDMLKNQLEVENFTGTKPVLIVQDVLACVFLFNLAQDMIYDAQVLYDAQKKVSKHRMVVNRGFAIGVLKDELVGVLLETNGVRKRERFLAMIEMLKMQVLPVRPDRSFVRNKGNFAGKYCNTRKRCY